MRTILALLLTAWLATGAAAQVLTHTGASVNDTLGMQRTTFTSGERIAFRMAVSLSANTTGGEEICFVFRVKTPAGATVLTHANNRAPGTIGGAQSQIAMPVATFYSVPGEYTYAPAAKIGPSGAEVPGTPVKFTISSPNITLIYPPYGARSLSDRPLTFRWAGSGASRYRVTVSDNAGLYNPLHTGTNSGESQYSYPENPTEPREQLVPDQVYYWKVEGLDSSNNVISQSSIYNFSLKSLASSQSRNVLISALELTSPALDFEKPLNFKATIMNSGSMTESNISVRFTLGGLGGADSPKQVATIAPGERQDIPFTAFMPGGQEQGLAVACADLFDDNVPDNCKTKLVGKSAAGAPVAPPKQLSFEEMFNAIIKRLGPEAASMLEGYTFSSLSCAGCSQDDLYAIIAALISGEAQLVGASVLDGGGAASAASSSASPEADSMAAPEETSLDIAALAQEDAEEWSGYTEKQPGDKPQTFVVKTRKEWRRVWKLIAATEEPEVDFDAKMVAGIIASAADRAQTVRLLGKRRTDEGIAFDYYMIEAPKGEEPPASAYVFKLFDRDEAKAEFKRLDVK